MTWGHHVKYYLSLLVLLISISIPLDAKTATYFPKPEDIFYSLSLELTGLSPKGIAYFNPAILSKLDKYITSVSNTQNAANYSQMNYTSLFPFKSFAIMFQLDQLSSSTLSEVSHNGFKPYVSKTFSDQFTSVRIALGLPINANLSLGLKGQGHLRKLYTAHATAASTDLSILYSITSNLNIGISTNYFLATPLQWSTGHADYFSTNH